MASNQRAGMHFRDVLGLLHLIDMHFVLHKHLIAYTQLGELANTSKQFLIFSQSVPSSIVSVGLFLDPLLHGLLEAIS